MKYAVVDLGSNTVRLAVYETGSGRPVRLFTKKVFARAISYVEGGRMSAAGISAVTDALTELVRLASLLDITRLWCFATACLRQIDNRDEVLAAIRRDCGVEVEVLSEAEEAALGVNGLLSVHSLSDTLCIDLGGGSCEISLIRDGKTVQWTSLDIGCVSASKKYISGVFPTEREMVLLAEATDRRLASLKWLRGCGVYAAYGMGGTVRSLCRMARVLGIAEGTILTSAIGTLEERLCAMGTAGVRLVDQHCPGRVCTLLPGMAILYRIMNFSGVVRICPASAGLREGYLLKKLDGV